MKKIHSHNSGTGREWKKPIPIIREREGNEKKAFPEFGNGKGMKKTIPIIREREGNEKKAFPKFGNGKGMKKSIPIIRERESEAFILGNGREREFPLTPDSGVRNVSVMRGRSCVLRRGYKIHLQNGKQIRGVNVASVPLILIWRPCCGNTHCRH